VDGLIIESVRNMNGRTWKWRATTQDTADGWAARFLKARPNGVDQKYQPLREAIQMWLADGAAL
jgi:hypothetical protein